MVLSFCLHWLAITAVLGSFAHIVHFLANEYLLAQLASTPVNIVMHLQQPSVPELPGIPLAGLLAQGFLALLVSLMAVLVLLRSTLHAHREACIRLTLRWLDQGPGRQGLVSVRIENGMQIENAGDAKQREPALAEAADGNENWQHYVLDEGCYSNHWALMLSLCPVNAEQIRLRRGRFCILIMRDAVDENSFRHLRLWMRLVAPLQLQNQTRVNND